MYPHSDPRQRPVELGASIFVEANRHVVKAARVSFMRHCTGCADMGRSLI